MEYEFIRHRITELRMKQGVSEYKMSLDLGHSQSFIQNIASGRSKPSIEELLNICEYFGTTPKAFFDEGEKEPVLVQKALEGMRRLDDKDLLMLIGLIDRLRDK